MADARLELGKDIQQGSRPTINITRINSTRYLIEFSIYVDGLEADDSDDDDNHPLRHSHRDYKLQRPLYIANHKTKVKARRGVNASTLEIEALIASKIPGTGGLNLKELKKEAQRKK